MDAVQLISGIKGMQFFDDKRSLDDFMADWEMRMFGKVFPDDPSEVRAMRVWHGFVDQGLIEEEKR